MDGKRVIGGGGGDERKNMVCTGYQRWKRQPGKPSRTDGQSICAGMIKNKKAILGRARTHREVLVLLGRKRYWWGRLVHRFEKWQGNGAFSSKLERIPLFLTCLRGAQIQKRHSATMDARELSTIGWLSIRHDRENKKASLDQLLLYRGGGWEKHLPRTLAFFSMLALLPVLGANRECPPCSAYAPTQIYSPI